MITPREDVRHVLVFGSQGFRARSLVLEYVRNLPTSSVLITGGAPGVDALAYGTAFKRMATLVLRPRWGFVGKPAGPERNQWMADLLPVGKSIATGFWDTESPGTGDMLRRLALRRRNIDPDLRILVIDENGERWDYISNALDGSGYLVVRPEVDA